MSSIASTESGTPATLNLSSFQPLFDTRYKGDTSATFTTVGTKSVVFSTPFQSICSSCTITFQLLSGSPSNITCYMVDLTNLGFNVIVNYTGSCTYKINYVACGN